MKRVILVLAIFSITLLSLIASNRYRNSTSSVEILPYIEMGSEEILVERLDKYQEFKDFALSTSGSYFTYVSYHFSSPDDDLVKLNVHLNCEKDSFNSLRDLWLDEFSDTMSIEVFHENRFFFDTTHKVVFISEDDLNNKLKFYSEDIRRGSISLKLFDLNKEMLKNTFALEDDRSYILHLALDNQWKISNYRLELDE